MSYNKKILYSVLIITSIFLIITVLIEMKYKCIYVEDILKFIILFVVFYYILKKNDLLLLLIFVFISILYLQNEKKYNFDLTMLIILIILLLIYKKNKSKLLFIIILLLIGLMVGKKLKIITFDLRTILDYLQVINK